MYCTKCGTKFEGQFCPKCGTPVQVIEENETDQIQITRENEWNNGKKVLPFGTCRMIINIVSIVLFFFIILQSCSAGVLNTIVGNDESSGSAGALLAFCWLVAGIVGLAGKQNRIAVNVSSVFYLFGGIIGISNVGLFADLAIWSGLSLAFGIIGILAGFVRDNETFQRSGPSALVELAILGVCVGIGIFCIGDGSVDFELGNDETASVEATENAETAAPIVEELAVTDTEPEDEIEETEPPVKKKKKVSYKKINAAVKKKYKDIIDDVACNSDYCEYAYYDINKDGIKDLIVGSGSCEADYVNTVYTANKKRQVSSAGSFWSLCQLYEAENGKGIYAVYGHMGYETVTQVTLKNGKVKTKELWSKEVSNDEYYSNSKPITTKEANSSSQSSYGNEGDYILPYSDSSYLTAADVNWMSPDLLRLARNEIYARHGRIFDSADLSNYFNSQSWYTGLYTADEFSDDWLNAYEKENILLIQSYE